MVERSVTTGTGSSGCSRPEGTLSPDSSVRRSCQSAVCCRSHPRWLSPIGIYTSLCAGGTVDISRWSAQRNHRIGVATRVQALKGRRTGSGLSPFQGLPAALLVSGGQRSATTGLALPRPFKP